MLEDLLASMAASRTVHEIAQEWRKRVSELILTNENYKNTELVENLIAIAQEAASAQIKIHEEFSGKVSALLELEERKKSAEDSKTVVN